jgi:Ricin-type beta-trefoil lectin domain-like
VNGGPTPNGAVRPTAAGGPDLGQAAAGPDPDATTVLTPVGATRADLSHGAPPPPLTAMLTPAAPTAPTGGEAWGAAAPVHQPGTEYSTGTFTRVLLTGLGGSVEPAPPEPAPPPAGPATARDRAVATTRRLAARVAALRGDERTALLVVAAVVGVVLLLLAVLVLVVRLATGRGGDPVPAVAPTPAASAGTSATASAGATPGATPSPTGSPLPPSGGTFASKRSGLCLAAPQGRADPGAQLVQRACGTDFGTGFLLVDTAQPGQYELVNAGASRCADVLNASTDNGAPVVQWDCNGGPNQTFQLRPLLDTAGTDTGYVQIVAAHSGKCLDVAGGATNDGAPVQQWDCRDPVAELDPSAGNQSWRFSPD